MMKFYSENEILEDQKTEEIPLCNISPNFNNPGAPDTMEIYEIEESNAKFLKECIKNGLRQVLIEFLTVQYFMYIKPRLFESFIRGIHLKLEEEGFEFEFENAIILQKDNCLDNIHREVSIVLNHIKIL